MADESRNLFMTMANVTLLGAVQNALMRTLVARKIITQEIWDEIFATAEATLVAHAAERSAHGKLALDALFKLRDTERPDA